LVEKDSYLLELARYIVLNPVRAGMVRSTKDWPWSSYRATAGQCAIPEFLTVDWILAAFAGRKSLAVERYRQFISEGKNQASPWQFLRNQVYLGDEQFVEDMKALIDNDKPLTEIPLSQRRPASKSLDEYVRVAGARNAAIVAAYQSGGYTLKEIGEYFGLHYSTVSGIVGGHKSKT